MNQVWPCSRFYWSVLDGFEGIKAGPLPQGVLAAFEDDVPTPAEELWAIGAPAADGRLIICAAVRGELRSLEPGVTNLTPEIVPGFADFDPSRLNLLVGEFEPLPLRRARRALHLVHAGLVLICACLLGTGFSRRATVWSREAAEARKESRELIASVAPSALWTKDDLAMEVMRNRTDIHAELRLPADAALALSSFIRQWPTEVPAKAQGISVTGESASLSLTVPGEPASFLSAVKAPAGWRMDEPRLTAIESATRLSLEFRRSEP